MTCVNNTKPSLSLSHTHAYSQENKSSDGVCATLTKFDPLPNTEPAIYCSSDCGAWYGNMDETSDVFHDYGCNHILVYNNGPVACFNLSSVVPYNYTSSPEYILDEIEVFTIQYEYCSISWTNLSEVDTRKLSLTLIDFVMYTGTIRSCLFLF